MVFLLSGGGVIHYRLLKHGIWSVMAGALPAITGYEKEKQ
jgi:hypothetical protein